MPLEPIGDSLKALLSDLGLATSLRGWEALNTWAEVVGPRAAARTRATGYEAGRMIVEVDGAVWMTELGYMKRDIIARLNHGMNAEVVTDILFVPARGEGKQGTR